MSDLSERNLAILAHGVSGGQTDVTDPALGAEPPAAPEAAPAPAPAGDPMEAAAAAMHARVLGDQSPEDLLPDGAPYRDAAALRAEMASARETFKPFADAFGSMAEADRAALLETAPSLGSDLPYVARAFSGLEPEDRRVLTEIIAMIPDDPEGAAELLAQAATLLRGTDAAALAAPAAPEADADALDALGFRLDDPNRPMTKADLDKTLRDFAVAQDQMRADREQWDAVQRELRESGYDPDTKNPLERARVNTVVELARMLPDGSVLKAHEMLVNDQQAKIQQAIDQYVEGKTADADRPGPPDGGAPSDGSRRLVSMEDGAAAMANRLDAAGINRRR